MKIMDAHGLKRFIATTSSVASKPMQIDIYANGDVYVHGRATNHQLARLIELIIEDAKR